jgi:hypothetical protein
MILPDGRGVIARESRNRLCDRAPILFGNAEQKIFKNLALEIWRALCDKSRWRQGQHLRALQRVFKPGPTVEQRLKL